MIGEFGPPALCPANEFTKAVDRLSSPRCISSTPNSVGTSIELLVVVDEWSRRGLPTMRTKSLPGDRKRFGSVLRS